MLPDTTRSRTVYKPEQILTNFFCLSSWNTDNSYDFLCDFTSVSLKINYANSEYSPYYNSYNTICQNVKLIFTVTDFAIIS